MRVVAMIGMVALAVGVTVVAGAQSQAIPPWRQTLSEPPEETHIRVGETELEVELAVTSEETTLGLGYRNGLAPGTGMLFVGDDAQSRSFWMKGMRFCLDIVWIEDGALVGAAERVCPDPPGTADADRASYVSPEPVTHVLEVPAGWLDEHGYGPGTPVDLSTLPQF